MSFIPGAAAEAFYADGRRAFDAGLRPAARALYSQCIAVEPRHAGAHHDLGIMAGQDGDNADAARLLERAVALRPGDAEALSDLCLVLIRSGRFQDAARAGAAAVAARAHFALGHFNLGMALEGLGQDEAASRSFRAAVDCDPNLALGWTKLSNALRRQGRLDAALTSIDRSVMLQPGSHGARVMRGLILDALGRPAEAGEEFASAFGLCPPVAEALNYLGVICIDQRRFDLAIDCLRRAVLLDPELAEPQGNLGLALHRLGRRKEAFDAYVRAVSLDPTHVVAQCNLGGLLLDINELDAAISTLRLATRLDPTRVEAHVYLGIALKRKGQPDKAIAAFREALRHRPTAGEALIELCGLRLHTSDWRELDTDRAAILAQVRAAAKGVPPFQVLGLTGSAADHRQAARTWAAGFRRKVPPLTVYAPRALSSQGQKLRIGYLSADFRTHATAMLIAEVFELHDRSRFEIIGYSSGEDDRSPMRRRLIAAMDRFVDVRPLPHHDAARMIHADGIDILIDLKGYTNDARTEILALRPASIQVNYLGFPGTMGAEFIDYIIADPVVAPAAHAAHFDEKIVRLPHSYQPNDTRRAAASAPPTRAACGLPTKGFVFCCLNNNYKITPDVFDVWMRLLRAEPGAALWLLADDGAASENLRREAAARGVEPSRLVFAPKIAPEDHLARLPLADLFLDTHPVNAHTTASEALWAGLPVLTMAGEAFVSRVAASLLHAVGLPELVTASPSEYEGLAGHLARERVILEQFRTRLREARATAPLFDTQRYTRNFEAALATMADLRDQGRPPKSFTVIEQP